MTSFQQIKYTRLLLCIIIFSAGLSVSGQATHSGLDKLPPEIKAAFTKRYTITSEEIWTVNDQNIVVSFKSGNDNFDAFFSDKGKWLRTEKSILFDQLPKVLKDSLKTGEFSKWEKGSVFEVELPEAKKNFKIFVYSKEWDEMELNFDKTGKRIL